MRAAGTSPLGQYYADLYIVQPLDLLATQVADILHRNKRLVLSEMNRNVRQAAGFSARAPWSRLPVSSFQVVTQAIAALRAKHQPDFEALARAFSAPYRG